MCGLNRIGFYPFFENNSLVRVKCGYDKPTDESTPAGRAVTFWCQALCLVIPNPWVFRGEGSQMLIELGYWCLIRAFMPFEIPRRKTHSSG